MVRRLTASRIGAIAMAIAGVVWLGAPGTAAAAAATKSPTKKQTVRSSPTAKRSMSPRARRARARAAARARLWREATTPRFKQDESGMVVPDLRAAAAVIYSPETGEVLWGENSYDQRSIASITKVMTAAVFLEDAPELAQKVTVERADVRAARHTYLRAGESVTLDDLLHLTLIASDNAAARVLARTSAYGSEGFVDRMNEKARELGLTNTAYADPSGLNPDNLSTAYDMARLIAFVSSDERLAAIMRKPHHTVLTSRRVVGINSTNQLLVKGDVDVRGGKTGFISKAGYCLASLLRLPQTGQQVAVVVLGARSNAGRFWETRHLVNWLTARTPGLAASPEATGQPN